MKATAELYQECAGIINKMVHHYALICPAVDAEELNAEAALIFCRAAENYDPEKGTTFTSHLYNQLKALTHFIRSSARHAGEVTRLTDPETGDQDDALNLCGEWDDHEEGEEYYLAMGPDARAVVDLYFQGKLDPPAASKVRKGTQLTAWGAYHRLFHRLGWTWARTQAAWADLVKHLNLYRYGLDLDEFLELEGAC